MSEFVERAAQPCVAIPVRATLRGWGTVNALVPEVFAWLSDRGIPPAGPLFYRYRVIGDADEEFEVEVGVPVAAPVAGDGRVQGGAAPAGRYAVRVHHGHPDEMARTHRELLAWAQEQGSPALREGERWAGVFEYYRSDPDVEPDPAKWETEIAYLVSQPLR
jgi:effector-binding domain-containing protein